MARPRRQEEVLTLSPDVAEAAKGDRAAALAFFLMESTRSKSIFAEWSGRIPAPEQRALFGCYVGKGRFYIDGTRETVDMTVDVCFGTMRDLKHRIRWADLPLAGRPRDERHPNR